MIKKKRTTLVLASLEDNSSSDMRAGKSYTDFDLNLWILLTYLLTYFFTYILTYSLHWTVLHKLPGFQLVKKFPAFCGTQKFITAFTSPRQLSLSWASSIQSIPLHPTSWRPILILTSHLRLSLPSGLFSSGFPTKTLFAPLIPPMRATGPPSHSFWFNQPKSIGWGAQIINPLNPSAICWHY